MEDAPESATVPIPAPSHEEKSATIAAVKEFKVPPGSVTNLTATASNVAVEYQQNDDMDTEI